MATNFSKELRVKPGTKVKLSKWDPDDTLGWEKGNKSEQSLAKALARIDSRQYLLYASKKYALLVALGTGCGRQGRHDPQCDVGGKPPGLQGDLVQGALGGRNAPRLSLAHTSSGAGPWRYRDLQPLAL